MKPFIWTLAAGFILVVWVCFFFIHSAKEKSSDLLSVSSLESTQISPHSRSAEEPEIPKEIPFKPGEQEIYYSDQSRSAVWNFNEDMSGGILRAYYRTGQLWMEMPFRHKLPHGTVRYYYPEGTIWIEEIFVDGQLEGRVNIYYDTGGVWKHYEIKEGLIRGLPEIHSEKQKDVGLSTDPKPESQQGYFKVYDESGNLLNAWEGAGDQQNKQVFYENGQLSAEFQRQNELAHGTYRFYYRNEQVLKEGHVREGHFVGRQKMYHVHGGLWTEISCDEKGTILETRAYYPSGAEWFRIQHNAEIAEEYPRLQSELQAEVV